MVRAAAKTGKEKAKRKEVIKTDQTKRGTIDQVIPLTFIFIMVTIKLIAPRIEETPAMCKLRIPKSTAGPSWNIESDKGGYTVQPVPTPDPTIAELTRRDKEGGRSQKLILFKRG